MTSATTGPATDSATDAATAPDAEHPPSRWRITPGRVLAGVVIVGSLALWIYAFVLASPRMVDRLDDRTFPTAAEPVCRAAVEEVRSLPKSQESTTPADRAAVLSTATTRLRQMTAELRTLVPASADAAGINLWIDHWNVYLDDRTQYAEQLAGLPPGGDAQFTVSAIDSVQITRSIDHFAEVNSMTDCETPGDV